MSKIIVPQELQEQIIDLYVNKQRNRKQIKEELHLSFGDSAIKRILEENNIPIRTNNGAKAGGRKKVAVSREIQDEIIKLYNKGYGLNKIVKELDLPFGFDKVKSILKDNDIKIRNVQESAKVKEMPDLRKYQINDDYNFESHNGAWILGFIAADGYLPITNGAQNRVVISLQRQDEEVLDMISKELGYTGHLYQYETSNGGYPASSLSFTSKVLREKIESYGIGNNKTFKLNGLPQNLPKEYMLDYIRGYFDGDGSLYEPKGKKINMNFTSADRQTLQDIVDYLHKEYNLTEATIYSQEKIHTIYEIKYYVKDSLKLGKLFYDNDYLSLPRKKKHYFSIVDKYSLREQLPRA